MCASLPPLLVPLQCSKLGSHLNTLLDHYQQFQEVAESLRTWLQESEAALGKLLSETVSSDVAVLQKQLASTKVQRPWGISWELLEPGWEFGSSEQSAAGRRFELLRFFWWLRVKIHLSMFCQVGSNFWESAQSKNQGLQSQTPQRDTEGTFLPHEGARAQGQPKPCSVGLDFPSFPNDLVTKCRGSLRGNSELHECGNPALILVCPV